MNVLTQRIKSIKTLLKRLVLQQSAPNRGVHTLIFQRLFWGALAGCLMAVFFGDSPLLWSMELNMLDWRYRIADRLTHPTELDSRAGKLVSGTLSKDIVLVTFDDSSQFDLGVPRFNESHAQEILGQVLETIEAGKPTVVGVDVDLRGAANAELLKLFRRYRNVVLAVFGSLEGSSDLPAADFLMHAQGYGYDELTKEANGTVLRLPVNMPGEWSEPEAGMAQVPSFVEAVDAAYRHNKGLGPDEQLAALEADHPVYINFKRVTYQCFSMQSLFEPEFDTSVFTDKIVLIGSTLTSRRQDPTHARTPLRGIAPDIFIHADALTTLLNKYIVVSYPRPLARHLMILLGATFGALSSIFPMGRRALYVLCGGVLLVTLAQIAFQVYHVALPVVSPLAMLGSGFILGTVIYLDTDLRQRNRELAAAREQMQVRAEEERKRIAGDLHDETLPALSAVARMVDELYAVEDPAESPVPQRMRNKLDETIQEMRRVINDLHPSVLETMGFVPALENLLGILSRERRIEAIFTNGNGSENGDGDAPSPESLGFETDPEYLLSDFAKLQLYRIVQEALNNVGKHSQAQLVCLKIHQELSALEIVVSDNGRGINPRAIRKDSHGLLNIKHRAQLIGAHVEWRKPHGFPSGTEMSVRIAIDRPNQANQS